MSFKPDLIIFDLDGTLADTKDDIATAVTLTLSELGLPPKSRDQIYSYVGGGIRRLLQQAVGEEEGDRFREALRIFRGHYISHILDTTKLYPGMDGVLRHFASRKKAVVTNKAQYYTDRLMAGLNLTQRFDLIVGGDNGHPLKPDPAMLRFVLEQLQMNSRAAVMIGDSVNDIAASRAAGIPVCAVGYGLGDADELRRAEPDFFCETVNELKSFIS